MLSTRSGAHTGWDPKNHIGMTYSSVRGVGYSFRVISYYKVGLWPVSVNPAMITEIPRSYPVNESSFSFLAICV